MTDIPLPHAGISRWMAWAQEIQAIGQTGLNYHSGDYDEPRYHRLVEIAAEMLAYQASIPQEPILRDLLTQLGYATPKIDVRGAVVRQGKILLVQDSLDQKWCMPGGWADVGETPSDMVAREVWEESGFRVEPRRVLGVYDANRTSTAMAFFHAYKIVFMCEIVGGEPRPSSETLAVDFFDFDALPPLSLARTNPRHLADALARATDPSLPAAFD